MCAYSASATAPSTEFLMVEPDAYSAPPQENWMMPSDCASAKPRSAAIRVCEEETFIAGYANAPALARSSIWP